ncbi:NAD(P)H-binding protein [Streptomyces sp. H27-D2]|uniref:NAD(P)H-binding protein n=1 Tax=Streptomyces sp. H27-D2 TaxID=3046304 RepID=UPI002DB5FB64|nr:NAD(P)H-binding protein [Streptomyces sp. H27-D2]MEC4015471.1 NAD(P)H-binding protein [Streptomyces sp. H27-D2]
MTILVTGASGNIGSRVVSRLHEGGHTVRASGRKPAELTLPDGVESVELDLSRPETFAAALRGVSRVFLYAEPEGVNAWAAAARSAGVRHVVLLSSSVIAEPGVDNDPLAQHHAAVEEALSESGLATTVLRPGAFAVNALGWSYAVRGKVPVEQAYLDAQTAPVHEDDIADVAVAALSSDAFAGQVLTLSGPESLSFRQQLAIVGELLGREVAVRELGREEAQEQMGRFVPPPILASLLGQWAAAVGRPSPISDVVEKVTGRPARTFRQWAQEHVEAFADPA